MGSTLGSTQSIKYPKSTLKQIDSKGGYYFVICTIPKELRLSGKDKAAHYPAWCLLLQNIVNAELEAVGTG